MPSEARQKKIMETLNRAQKCSILGPQNLGSKGGARAPLDPRLKIPELKSYQPFLNHIVNKVNLIRGHETRHGSQIKDKEYIPCGR